jgi:hypothetical protein
MKFSLWLEKRNQKTDMKMPTGDRKQRVAGGRKNTTFDTRPKRLRTRQSQNKQSQDGY